MLARPARRATYHRALRSGELIPQNERELRRSGGSGMLKGDPLIRGAMLAPPITSSGERRTHSSEWEGTPPLRRERHAHRWPSGWGEQCGLYQQRALGSGKLIPRNEWTFRRSEGSGILIGNPPKVRGVMLALPTARERAEERGLILQRSEGSGMLIGDPGKLIPQNERELTFFFFFFAFA